MVDRYARTRANVTRFVRRAGAQGGLLLCLGLAGCAGHPPRFPVTPELFSAQFRAAEGITFNARGELFVGANRRIWRLSPDGGAVELAAVDTHLGQAGYGDDDILAADFGPQNVFAHKQAAANDGVIWRIGRDGGRQPFARGIADPNVILVLPDRGLLVSDDGTDIIYRVEPDGAVSVWSRAVPYPNGLVLSPDHKTLYVAQSFRALDPVVPDDALWAIPLADYRPAGPARVVARTGGSLPDGLAINATGRVYIADNGSGRVLRFDPGSGELLVVAEGMPHVASLVFGEGAFDAESLYATSTFKGGGKLWRIPVGARGLPPIR